MSKDVTTVGADRKTSLPDEPALSRRRLITSAGMGAAALAGLTLIRPAEARGNSHDATIVAAAATAEALATTMYYNIVNSALFTGGLNGNVNDQAYLVAGYEEELNHYNLLSSVVPALTTTFYFPKGMFDTADGGAQNIQTTLNTLVTLEDAFIAAYLIGVRDLSPGFKVLAAQIMGVEAEHRTLGRVIAADLGLTTVSGLAGAEGVRGSDGFASNNLAYERTFSSVLPDIAAVETALGPFIAPGAAGFSATPFRFSDATVKDTQGNNVSKLSQSVALQGTTPNG